MPHFVCEVLQSLDKVVILQYALQLQNCKIGWTIIILFRYSVYCICTKNALFITYTDHKTQLCNGLADNEAMNGYMCMRYADGIEVLSEPKYDVFDRL